MTTFTSVTTVATRTTKERAGGTSRKASKTNEEQLTSDLNWQTIGVIGIIDVLAILAIGTLILLGKSAPPVDFKEQPSYQASDFSTTIAKSSGGVPEHGNYDDFIDASSGEFKDKLIYLNKHNPGLYTELRDVWRRKQGMGQMDPFEAAADIGDDWDRCYSDSFDGSWMC